MSTKPQSLSDAYLTLDPCSLVCSVLAFLFLVESWALESSPVLGLLGGRVESSTSCAPGWASVSSPLRSRSPTTQRGLVRMEEIMCWKGKCCTDVSHSYFSACQPCSASASWHWKIQLRALLVLAFICSMGRVHPLLFAQIFNSVHFPAPPALRSGFTVYQLSCAFSRSAQVPVNPSPALTPSVYVSIIALCKAAL